MREIRTIRLLLPLLKIYRWGLPATILLGTLSSLAEGIGISLFAPLIESLDGERFHMPALGWLERVI